MPRHKGNIRYKWVRIPEIHYEMLIDISEKLGLNIIKTLEYIIHEAHDSLFLAVEEEERVKKQNQPREYAPRRRIAP